MSKRKKIALTLAAVLVAVGTGAQIYTNYQVDRVLQKFPYSFDNQAMLHLSENNKNFFSRDLTFSVQESDEQPTAIITTKLTTLPFFITAESTLSDQLVRQLNKSLNITIDKNTINSKFSPLGDYFQADILTEFRDFANKPQQMTLSLNFLKNKEIELSTDLSGFNYDNESKLEKVEGKIHLIPVNNSQYDLTNIEFTAKNAEVALLNGENTRLQLKNATYTFNSHHHENAEKRDLMTKFSADILRIANKNRTTEESQTTFGGLNLSLNQQGVPSAVNFYHEFKALRNDQQPLRDGVKLLTDVLTQNETFDGKLSVISVNAPKNQKPYFSLKNGDVSLKLANSDLAKANVDFQLQVENVKQTPEDEAQKWEAKDGKLSVSLKDYHLDNEIAFIPFFLESLSAKGFPEKDNKDFLKLKEKWAKEFGGNQYFDLSIKNLSLFKMYIDGLSFNDKTEPLENEQYNENISLNAKNILVPKNEWQAENLSISIPLKVNYYHDFSNSLFCFMDFYDQLCMSHLTKDTLYKYSQNKWKDLDLTMNNAVVKMNLNTFPPTQSYPIELDVSGAIHKNPKGQEQGDSLLKNVEGTLNFSFDKNLVENTDEKVNQIKARSLFWRRLKEYVKPQDELLPYFVQEGANYMAKFEKNKNGILVNGQPLEDLKQEALPEKDLESEENQ